MLEELQKMGGKELSEIKNIVETLPKDHKWLGILLIKHIKNGWNYKFVYGDMVYDKPMKFTYDDERGGIGVERPDKVLIYKKVKVGYWEEDELVGEIDFRRFSDPDFEQSLNILDIVDRL